MDFWFVGAPCVIFPQFRARSFTRSDEKFIGTDLMVFGVKGSRLRWMFEKRGWLRKRSWRALFANPCKIHQLLRLTPFGSVWLRLAPFARVRSESAASKSDGTRRVSLVAIFSFFAKRSARSFNWPWIFRAPCRYRRRGPLAEAKVRHIPSFTRDKEISIIRPAPAIVPSKRRH